MPNDTMNIKEAAAYLELNEPAVRKLVETGKIKAIKKGDLWIFKKDSIHDALNYQIKSLKQDDLANLEMDQDRNVIQIHSLLKPEHIVLQLIGTTKSEILEEMVSAFAKGKKKEKKDVLLKAVRDREKLCTTAISEGVAIPHPRKAIKNLVKKPVIIFGRSKPGVDFEAIDGNQTKLFFLICAPKDDIHLKIMARLSRLLRNYTFRKELLDAQEKEDVIAVVKKYEQQDTVRV